MTLMNNRGFRGPAAPWRVYRLWALAVLGAVVAVLPAPAATLVPLASFGGGDGNLAPDDRSYLTIDNTQRGLAYNPVTGHLLLVNRSGGLSIHILDGLTGDDLGTLSQGTGVITGGLFTGNMIGAADDGAIYMGNLTTVAGTNGDYKVYRWADEASEPTVAYSGVPLVGARMGDTIDVRGGGTGTQVVAAYAASPAVAGNNSFALLSTADGSTFSATHIDIATVPPNPGDFRLGITFRDSDTVMGRQATNRLARIVDISGSSGTLVSDFATEGQNYNGMDFAEVDGKPLLALVNLANSATAVYDITEPYDMIDPNPSIAVGNASSTANANGNGTGQVKFGAINGNKAIVYAMNTNNGIQAYELRLDTPVGNNGDYNGDGFVDAADYIVWRDTDGQAAVPPGSGADGDGDGVIGPADYTHWAARFGNTIGSGSVTSDAAIPEPCGLTLVLLATVSLAFARRRIGENG